MHGPLRVGAIPTILPYYLTPLLKGFIERYQDVDLHVREGRRRSWWNWCWKGRWTSRW